MQSNQVTRIGLNGQKVIDLKNNVGMLSFLYSSVFSVFSVN